MDSTVYVSDGYCKWLEMLAIFHVSLPPRNSQVGHAHNTKATDSPLSAMTVSPLLFNDNVATPIEIDGNKIKKV